MAVLKALLPPLKQAAEDVHFTQGEIPCKATPWGPDEVGGAVCQPFRDVYRSFPQQFEKLEVLPVKLRGGLGQPPETWNQVPKVPYKGSTLSCLGPKSFSLGFSTNPGSLRLRLSQGGFVD